MPGATGRFGAFAATILVAAAGILFFQIFHLPVPWLAGSMVAVAIMAMRDYPTSLPPLWRDFGLLVSGVSMGGTVTPDAIAMIQRYPVSLIGLALSIIGTIVASTLILQKIFKWDKPTAFLSSVPGALSMVMIMAAESSADVRRVAVVQAVRLFFLMAVMPAAITASSSMLTPPLPQIVGPVEMGILFLATIAFTAILSRLKVANPLFLGGMIVGTVLHVTGLIHGALPGEIVNGGMMLVGIFCGLRFQGATFRMLTSLLLPSVSTFVAALCIALFFAFAVQWMTGLRLAEILVAFAPGGVEAMILLGAALGLDTLYISTHHVLRAVSLNAMMPFFTPKREERGDA